MDDERLMATFVELADTLTDDFDLIEFLHLLADRCVELLDVDAAALLLADQHAELQLIATSNEQARLVELCQSQYDEGPGLEAFRTGARVSNADLAGAGVPWPRFASAALVAGFAAVDALPMRLRTEVIGTLKLFRSRAGELSADALRTGQALADVATIGLLQQRSIRYHEIVAEQLRRALHSRVVIEQAKCLVAERLGVDQAGAFAVLRGYARDHHRKLGDVAHAVVTGQTSANDLIGTPGPARNPGW
ncbi:GAF and ANTAR domain-containing protein [Solihabitans fulvus]|uniref:GAF and ANTAR domain-containing protein n=1 Tax=Solihabitans fulvus TaxID=1892852 RepID=A0A5B2XE52_9PSEU|nr:GAF and ANTAR domain-containing protein [Solihabitans fulvus]KAA2261385.1 GAF and ANTAR domain-containing protein [Solihabitans fulvus]